jgi:hypothetical protein
MFADGVDVQSYVNKEQQYIDLTSPHFNKKEVTLG